MKKMLGIAVSSLVLAACASVEKPAQNGAQASTGTYFCWKGRLNAQGDNLVCNWGRDKREACDATYATSMSKSAVASGPTEAGRCGNGQWLVMITVK